MRSSLRIIAVLAAAMTLAACGSAPTRQAANVPDPSIESPAGRAADQALGLVGSPYRFGGASPAGFDCSGLVYYSFTRVGFEVPRDTDAQRRAGGEVDGRELAKGDLVFFDQDGQKASHVGIYLGDGRFVHAPSTGGRVRVDRIDSSYWRRYFNEARRL
jgi:cell wall-associated NlpC family hydrolase